MWVGASLHVDLLEEMKDQGHSGLMVALWPPPNLAERLAVEGGESLEDLHLTLAYCPDADLDPVQLARLIAALDDVALDVPPLKAKISGTGRFLACDGSDGRDVIYAGVDSPGLEDLRRMVLDCLARVGLGRSREHGYTPHITLQYVPMGDGEPPTIEPEKFEFDYLVLARGDEQVILDLRGSPASAKGPGPLWESELQESGPSTIGLDEPVAISEAEGDRSGSKWRAVLIRAGTSGNRVHYTEEVLKRAAPLFEGVRAYADHPTKDEQRNRPERSVRDVVGWYDNVGWDPKIRGLVGDFNILASAGWLREAMKDAWDRGKPDLFGFSINAAGMKSGKIVEGGYLLESIDQVRSTDVVTTPGAGGRLLDVLESEGMDQELADFLAEMRGSVLEATRTALVEKWSTKGKSLSAAHKAKISATLKAKASGARSKNPDGTRLANKIGRARGRVNARFLSEPKKLSKFKRKAKVDRAVKAVSDRENAKDSARFKKYALGRLAHNN